MKYLKTISLYGMAIRSSSPRSWSWHASGFCRFGNRLREGILNSGQNIFFDNEPYSTRRKIPNYHNEQLSADENRYTMKVKYFRTEFTIIVWDGIIGIHIVGPVILPHELMQQIYFQNLQNMWPTLTIRYNVV